MEDYPNDEELTRRALKRAGVVNRLVVLRDGAEALAYPFGTEEHPERAAAAPPAVLILDLGLPKVDGLEVLRRVREHGHTQRLPVVILTSSDDQRDLMESYHLGANGYVRKPVDFQEFAAAVRQLGLFWALVNEPPPDRRP